MAIEQVSAVQIARILILTFLFIDLISPFSKVLFDQVVWIFVTIQATLKVLQQRFWMRYAVAILTFGQIAVFVLVAERALEFCMFRFSGWKHGSDIIVAGTAESVGDILLISNVQRLMRIVTGEAIFELLFFQMGLMTLHAVGDVAMFVMMADRTVKGSVGAWVVLDLTDLV